MTKLNHLQAHTLELASEFAERFSCLKAVHIFGSVARELSGGAGLTFNARNTATDYQTGTESHFEWAIGKHFGESISLGVAGYHYVQLTGDTGSGATLGPFKGRNNGIGPALNFATQIGGHVAVLSLRHFWEYDAVRHFEGSLSTAAFTVRF